MISFLDCDGKRHNKCPRCSEKLTDVTGNRKPILKPDHIYCTPCNLMAVRDHDNKYFISLELGKYTVYWISEQCLISISDKDADMMALPILPFNINLNKLRTYITFG